MSDTRPRLVAGAQRLALRTSGGHLRATWRLAYEALAHAAARYLRGRDPAASVYVRGSLGAEDAIYGLSDIDLVVVAPADPARPGQARRRIDRRWRRVHRRLPMGLASLFESPSVYENTELEDEFSATTLTHGLEHGSLGKRRTAVQQPAREARRERAGAERPGLYSPAAEWRLLSGRDRLPPIPERDRQERRVCAWMELQYLWLQAFIACANPTAAWVPFTCVKLVAEPARIWLWLVDGERFSRRRAVLERALVRLPGEESALRAALDLHDRLRRSPPAPLRESIEALLRMSGRVAWSLEEEVRSAGHTEVELSGDPAELVATDDALAATSRLPGVAESSRPLPFTDWRTIVWPFPLPDEAAIPLQAEAADPHFLGAAARACNDGAYALLRANGLHIIPSLKRARLRAVHSPITDPVSFALAEGRTTARFPNLGGWSIGDTARRAVAEHLAWLRSADGRPSAETLGRLLGAARAGILLESLKAREPELPLTVTAAAERIAQRPPLTGRLGRHVLPSYRAARLEGAAPSQRVVDALYECVTRLPAYLGPS